MYFKREGMRTSVSHGQWTLTPSYACQFETTQENPGKSLEFLRINSKKSGESQKIPSCFFAKRKKKSWEETFSNGTVMLVSPNKNETVIHACHRLSNMAVRMRKVLAIPPQLRGTVNHCSQMVYSVQLVQFWVFMYGA